MRTGFEFLQEMIDCGYIDAQKAYMSEAIEGRGRRFSGGKDADRHGVLGAANTETAYGNPDFNMLVIGVSKQPRTDARYANDRHCCRNQAEHAEDAMKTLDIMTSDEALQIYTETNKVISPSKNVSVDCIPALKPLNDRINENIYVLGSNASMKLGAVGKHVHHCSEALKWGYGR